MKHIPKYCNIKGCKEEAYSWIPDFEKYETFYLCNDHHHELKIEDESDPGYLVQLEGNEINKREIGMYACHEECKECNDY